MSAKTQEAPPAEAEYEVPTNNESTLQCSSDSAKEIYRRDTPTEQSSECQLTSDKPKTAKAAIKPKTSKYKTTAKTAVQKKDSATPKMKISQSGIPLRMKSGTNTATTTPKTVRGSYRHQNPNSNLPVINKNTLEVQFMNNKKRLMQLHSDLVEKQRPLLDMHKSLQRTKKQLEELGKKVILEDIKIVSLKDEDALNKSQIDSQGAGETIIPEEAATELKTSIETVIGSCMETCQKCFVKSDDVVKMLESVSKSEIELTEIDVEVEEMKKQKSELEHVLEKTVEDNEKKIEQLVEMWQKALKSKSGNAEMSNKILELEEKIKQQQKVISEAEDNVVSLNRKFEEKKFNFEKNIQELQEKINKLEEELKKEKKNAADNLMKSRTFRGKLTDLESRAKEAEEKCQDAVIKLKQVQEQMRKKEIQWLKEKDDFKKNEALLQQKFTEKQSHFDTRLKDIEEVQKSSEKQQENFLRTMETQLEIKEQELLMMEKERDILNDRNRAMEAQIVNLTKQIEERDREIEELSAKQESVPAIEYHPDESHWQEVAEYKKKIAEVQDNLKQQTEQIGKMQSSLKAHAQLAVALKLEKDNAIKYSTKLRDILQEARDEIEYKNRTIYKIHEKLVLKEATCEKLKNELKELENGDACEHRHRKNRCQICMSSLTGRTECSSFAETTAEEVGSRISNASSKLVSKSLIGMSVRKVDNLRARLDNLKKMPLPGKKQQIPNKLSSPWSSQSCEKRHGLRDQIDFRGKLYTILQKHADQSCEDFIDLLKFKASSSRQCSQGGIAELKPSNMNVQFDERVTFGPENIQITKSYTAFSQIINQSPFEQFDFNKNDVIDEDEAYDDFEDEERYYSY